MTTTNVHTFIFTLLLVTRLFATGNRVFSMLEGLQKVGCVLSLQEGHSVVDEPTYQNVNFFCTLAKKDKYNKDSLYVPGDIKSGSSTLWSPYKLMITSVESFCSRGTFCHFQGIKPTFLSNRVEGYKFEIETYIKQLFLETLKTSKEFARSGDVRIALRDHKLSLSVILTIDLRAPHLDDTGTNTKMQSTLGAIDRILASLQTEMDDLQHYATVRLLVSVSSATESVVTQEVCAHIAQIMQDFMLVQCIDSGSKLLEGGTTLPDCANPTGAGYNSGSMRNQSLTLEQLARKEYETYDSDYYVLLDVSSSRDEDYNMHKRVYRLGWIVSSIATLQQNILKRYFGAVAMYSSKNNFDSRSSSSSSTAASYALPSALILHRTHFEIFNQANSVSDGQFSPRMNTLLLLDVYSVLQANYEFRYDYFATSEAPVQPAVQVSLLEKSHLLTYVSTVESLRRHVLTFLNRCHYQHAPIPWNRDIVSYGNPDTDKVLFAAYVTEAEGYDVKLDKVYNQQQTLIQSHTNKNTRLYHHHSASIVRIAYITALFGGYEQSLKQPARQTIPCDFICFTDNPHTTNPGNVWIVDTHAYHLDALQFEIDHNLTTEVNSLHNNQHPFNIAKYYKQNFHKIARLQQYDYVVWLDGTVQIHDDNISAIVTNILENDNINKSIIAYEVHVPYTLTTEMTHSLLHVKYASTSWGGYTQPLQDLHAQYATYIADGYNDSHEYWSNIEPTRPNYGIWVTCFLAFNMRHSEVPSFLNFWSEQNRRFSSQDQMSFPYVVQKTGVYPYSFPDFDNVAGDFEFNTAFAKWDHGN